MSFTQLDMLMIGVVLVAMLFSLWLAGWATARLGLSPELKRKVVHVLTGLVSLCFPWLFSSALPVIVMIGLALLSMAALRTPWLRKQSISTVLHDVQRTSYGEFYLLISVGLLYTLSEGRPVLYVLPLAVVALSDSASALIGTRYGSTHFSVAEGFKSLEGSTAFFVVTLLVSLILLMLMTDAADVNVIALAILVAGYTTAVESDSWSGLDNIFVPVGAHILLFRFLDATPEGLLIAFALLALTIVIMHKLAPVLRLTPHTARAYTLIVLLILSPSPNAQVMFPIVALASFLVARRTDPTQNPNRDMEMIGATAGVAMLWLFLDKLSAESTIIFFNLSFAGAAVIFAGIAVSSKWRWLTPVVAVTLCLLYTQELAVIPISSLVLCALSVMLLPRLFSNHRAIKAYGLAVIIPLLSFATGGWI